MKIEKIKKTGIKYNIVLDNGKTISTYEDVIIKNGLLFHKYINDNLLEKINTDTNYYKSYNKALDMINRRLRSEYEMRNYLSKCEVLEGDIEEIINSLKNIGLIDDRLYARAYTNDKINLSLDGPYKIKKHLEDNKIDNEYILEAISNIDENILYSHIDKLIDRKIKSNTKYTAYILKQKIVGYLINLGYDKNMIINRIEKFKIENKNSIREMEKIYNRLKSKYEGDNLYYKLKNKLFSKGYSNDEINEYIKTVH